MPNVKDPEIRLLEQLIKAGELDIALSYTQVLDRVPLVKARFATDPGYEKNFKNYWSNIRTKYRTQALLGRPTGDDYGEPTPPDPLDLPPARTPPSSAPSTPGRSSSPPSVSSPPSLSSSFSSMVGTTPPRHPRRPSSIDDADSSVARHPRRHPAGSVDDDDSTMASMMERGLTLSPRDGKLTVTPVAWPDDNGDNRVMYFVVIPTGCSDIQARIMPGGRKIKVTHAKSLVFVEDHHLIQEFERTYGAAFQQNEAHYKHWLQFKKAYKKFVNEGNTGPRMVSGLSFCSWSCSTAVYYCELTRPPLILSSLTL